MNEMKNSIEHGKFLSYVKRMNTTHTEYGLLLSKHPVLIVKYSKSRGKMLEYESLYRKVILCKFAHGRHDAQCSLLFFIFYYVF